MKVIEPGHIYQLQHQDGTGAGLLVFVNRETSTEHEGAMTQEVLRVLIDRTQHCDSCLRWAGNDQIIHHLRMALTLHESRAIERKTEKGLIQPEHVATAHDGHFALTVELTPAGRAMFPPAVLPPLEDVEARRMVPRYTDAMSKCNVPMCGESGVCDECRKRGAR